jgi:hypothetical protein
MKRNIVLFSVVPFIFVCLELIGGEYIKFDIIPFILNYIFLSFPIFIILGVHLIKKSFEKDLLLKLILVDISLLFFKYWLLFFVPKDEVSDLYILYVPIQTVLLIILYWLHYWKIKLN